MSGLQQLVSDLIAEKEGLEENLETSRGKVACLQKKLENVSNLRGESFYGPEMEDLEKRWRQGLLGGTLCYSPFSYSLTHS